MKMTRMFAFAVAGRATLLAVAAFSQPTIGFAEAPSTTSSGNRPFTSMAIALDDLGDCRVPRPPADLAETAYLRNGYRAILRILVAEKGLETETCNCLLDEFTWDMALDQLPRFQTSDNPRLPFKVLDLYALADARESELAQGCEE